MGRSGHIDRERFNLETWPEVKRQTVIHLLDEVFSGVMNPVVPPVALADIAVPQSN
jgi:hypothetical protein